MKIQYASEESQSVFRMSAPTLPGELEDRIRIEDFGSIQYFTSLSCGIESSLENPIDNSSNSLDGVVMGSRPKFLKAICICRRPPVLD